MPEGWTTWMVIERLSAVLGILTVVYALWVWAAPKLRLSLPLPASVLLLRTTIFSGRSPISLARAVAAALYCRFRRPASLTAHEAVRVFIEYQILRPRPRGSFVCPGAPDAADATGDDARKWDTAFMEFFATPRTREERPTIEFDTCFDLYNARDAFKRYFNALPSAVEKAFVCRVQIDHGFLAPLHLLTGLIDQFQSDWPKVIEAFGDDVRAGAGGGRHPALQTSMFNIWLLWGPSIPLCKCEQFTAGTAVQYGYGDENNSVPLFFSRAPDARQEVENAVKAFHPEHGLPPIAVPAAVTATPFYGKGLTNVSKAQQSLVKYPVVLRHPQVTRLNATPDECYYTSYVWVMFVLTDATGRPLYRDEPWRALYPLFEHTNIANVDAYATPKRQLARKAVATIASLSGRPDGPGPRFAYACAFDAAACSLDGKDRLVVPAPENERLRDEMSRLLKGEFMGAPGIFNLNADPTDEAKRIIVGNFSACHLPDIISAYYTEVEKESKEPDAQRERGDRGAALPRAG